MFSETMNTTVSSSSLDQLRARVRGTVCTPSDSRYNETRKAWNLTVDQYPAIIVEAANAQDVVQAVRFANQESMGIAVQSTGHGVAHTPDNHMLIVTSKMDSIRIDAESRTAWVEAGALWGPVLDKAQVHGLAPLLGSSPNVGVIGYTLGGGLGWLARKYGLSLDSVLFFDLVTAQGQLIRASRSENPDLFWALRGAGSSFGVIVGMSIKLYPVTTVFGGNLIYPVEMAEDVYAHYKAWIETAPEELTSSIALMTFPPVPEIPEFLHGKTAVLVRGCYIGHIAEGQALLSHWLDWRAPMANLWQAMPFSEVASISRDPLDPMPAYANGGAWVRELNDEVVSTLIRSITTNIMSPDQPSPLAFIEVRHVGGAKNRVDKDSTAFSHRGGSLLLEMVGAAPTPEALRHLEQYGRVVLSELQPNLLRGAYLNFLEGNEKWRKAREAFTPETYRRLMTLKARYDPNNVFRFGLNIPPKVETAESAGTTAH